MRLMFAMIYSSSIDEMTQFYGEGLGLGTANQSPFFVEFETGMTSLALLAIRPGEKSEFELCFGVDDVEAAVADLRRRGMEFIDEIRQQAFGKLIHMRDPDGNVVTLLEPSQPSAARGEPQLSTVLVNAWDFARATMFYRDRLGLPVLAETAHWIEFGTDGARIAVHARAERPDAPGHAKQNVACVFEIEELDEWAETLDARGTPLATDPTEETFGRYAEVVDPDGHLVVFREPAEMMLVGATAAAYADDEAPRRTAFRKPLKKGSKAVSRLALKPEYTTTVATGKKSKVAARKKSAVARKAVAAIESPPKRVRVASTRGAGPAGTRLAPKTRGGSKRPKSLPAIGRLRKAERRSVESKKQAVATTSRKRPVKRAAATRSASRRTVAKRTLTSRAR